AVSSLVFYKYDRKLIAETLAYSVGPVANLYLLPLDQFKIPMIRLILQKSNSIARFKVVLHEFLPCTSTGTASGHKIGERAGARLGLGRSLNQFQVFRMDKPL